MHLRVCTEASGWEARRQARARAKLARSTPGRSRSKPSQEGTPGREARGYEGRQEGRKGGGLDLALAILDAHRPRVSKHLCRPGGGNKARGGEVGEQDRRGFRGHERDDRIHLW